MTCQPCWWHHARHGAGIVAPGVREIDAWRWPRERPRRPRGVGPSVPTPRRGVPTLARHDAGGRRTPQRAVDRPSTLRRHFCWRYPTPGLQRGGPPGARRGRRHGCARRASTPTTDLAGNLIGRRAGSGHLGCRRSSSARTSTRCPTAATTTATSARWPRSRWRRRCRARGMTLRHPIEVAIWANEEGGLYGSRAVSGQFEARNSTHTTTSGKTIGDGIAFVGGDPDAARGGPAGPGQRRRPTSSSTSSRAASSKPSASTSASSRASSASGSGT